ncbi:SpoIVB peptidase S55 domain-containing protein [Sporomusa termitida]|uniref:Stage IV sporulation protein B n=1 Tax=Sporomusa termitida TaxID=2377 RepID=A0A517DXK5_9FIRM|nr:SpoIVB peptidase S55 domain-containing protein [Sporomusa termitida]QDR82090.1 stage IV sporulation protein B [Sporomusa termitida]
MFNILRRCLTALAAILIMLPIGYVQAAPEFMPVEQVVRGMHGTAKTVVSGSQIEEFGVEVLGVMKQKGPSGDLILVRTYGDVIERTGGIAQGMSGSPVYINGKLVGAVAYGWGLTDHKIGMVTPIADMLKLWELNGGQAELQTPAAPLDDNAVSTPLMASGFGDQALKMLADKLKPYNLTPYAVSGSMADDNNGIVYNKTVEPGSTIGLQLVRGDISLGALGTVTYVEGDKLLAFGHPFLKKGKVNYFLTDAEVYTTISGLENSFKVGTSTETIGVINQDRGAGIAGTISKFPNIVPLRITVTDKNLGRTNELWAQVVQDEELAPTLSAVSVFNAIEKTTDRVGSGTARISFEISAAGIPGEVLARENMFYTQGNVGELAIAEVHEALALLSSNQFTPVSIMDVKVNVAIDSERRTATILEAKANTAAAKPGDKVDIAVIIKPFRGEPLTQYITYTVPKEQQPGTLMLTVRGGGMVSIAQLVGQRPSMEQDLSKLFMLKARPRSLEEAVQDLVSRDRNNDIVVETIEMSMPDAAAGSAGRNVKPVPGTFETAPSPALPETTAMQPSKNGPAGRAAGKNSKGDELKQKVYVTTDYIIDGDTQVMLNIIK